MEKKQKQSLDLRPGKRFGVGLSNENLRIGADSAWEAKIAGTLDETRTKLDFEIGKGGVIKDIDQKISIPKRIKAILKSHNIDDPNQGLDDEQLKMKGVGVRTYASFILQGSHETMVKLAFGDQPPSYDPNADNSNLTRKEEIEKWAKDMYGFVAKKYGEDNIAAFVVHLDETTPHAHCIVVPISQSGKLSFKDVFAGKDKYEFSKRTKALWDEAAKISEKYGLERGDDKLTTGAKHKSYLQWMREQIHEKQNTIYEQDRTISEQGDVITRQANTISEQKQQLYAINGEIKKADKRLKGLTTMLNNLEAQKDNLEAQIAALEDEYSENNEQMEQRRAALLAKLTEIEEKIADKTQKREEAERKLVELAKEKNSLRQHYDDLMRQKVKVEPDVFEKVQQEMNSTMWEEATRELKKDYSALQDFSQRLPPEMKSDFNEIMEGSFIDDAAQRGEEIAAVAAALFLGYIDQATTFAHGAGGGGGSGGNWGRDKDEDDEAYRRRCCIMGRMMMKPAGRKLKR